MKQSDYQIINKPLNMQESEISPILHHLDPPGLLWLLRVEDELLRSAPGAMANGAARLFSSKIWRC